MVMRRDSHSEGHGFESRHRILDGHFFAYICCKNCNDVDLKRPKKRKRDRRWPIFKKKYFKAMSQSCDKMIFLKQQVLRLKFITFKKEVYLWHVHIQNETSVVVVG